MCARALGLVVRLLGKSWEKSWKFWSTSQNPGNHQQGILAFLHHQRALFTGAPITDNKRYHVTQPRARINVSCSSAGLKGSGGGWGDHKMTTKEQQRRRAEGQQKAGCQTKGGTGRHRAGDGTGSCCCCCRAGHKGAKESGRPRKEGQQRAAKGGCQTKGKTERERGPGYRTKGGTGLERGPGRPAVCSDGRGIGHDNR